jgi:hypothetical protein
MKTTVFRDITNINTSLEEAGQREERKDHVLTYYDLYNDGSLVRKENARALLYANLTTYLTQVCGYSGPHALMMFNGFYNEFAPAGLDHAEDFLRDVELLWTYTCAEDEDEDEESDDEEDDE